ncbi:MAG: hypothetical protein ABIG67_04910 [Pseudomonadota bacterium]
MPTHIYSRKTVIRRFIERTLKGERLGFEAYAFAAQRITGPIIVAFLIVHLHTLSFISGGETVFNRTMDWLDRPLINIGELILLWIFAFHGLNGLRLILVNLFPGFNHRRLAYVFSLISIIVVLISIPIVL